MRKFSIFLTVMVLSAMLLISCGGEETSTAVPNASVSPEVPAVTADTTATDDGVTATETLVSGDTTTTPGIPVTGEESAARLSNQLDFDVWNQDGEQIGEVDDMVLDLDNSRISYVVVGTGGFLDIGEKDVLVPWDSLVLHDGTVDVPGVEPNAFIIQMDQETFNNFPDVDLNSILPAIGEPANDWDVDIRSYWESGVVPTTPTADPNMTATTAPDAVEPTATVSTDSGTGEASALQGVVLASDVLGTSVALSPGQGEAVGQGTNQAKATADPAQSQATATVDPNQGSGQGVGNFSGTIEDMIVDTETGDILYIVVNTSLDDGERWIPIPLSSFQWDADNATALLNVNPAVLRDAPFFIEGEFPDTTVDGWNSEWDTFWQNN
jgi:sporulation protein YlmC with PRC-barrel domain